MDNFPGLVTGISVSPGIASGQAVLLTNKIAIERRKLEFAEVNEHIERLQKAIAQLITETEQLREQVQGAMSDEAAAILETHVLMLQDPALLTQLTNEITEERKNTAWAVEQVFGEYIQTFSALDDEYMRQRSVDLAEIQRRLIVLLNDTAEMPALVPGSILIAEELGPAQTIALDRNCIAAIVLEKGGRTSHTSILARTLAIPAMIGVAGITTKIKTGNQVIVDANNGKIYISPDTDIQASYGAQIRQQTEERENMGRMLAQPAVTLDGRSLELWANVGGIAETEAALQHGAQGLGLVRTEFLYMDRQSWPAEEEQEQIYREILRLMQGKPVVIRTLDIGADKQLPYYQSAPEENPALGCRAIRWCLQNQPILRTQLRALLKASIAGNLWIMFPMIATLDELRAAKALLAEVRRDLTEAGVLVADEIKVGMMVEIPVAAVNADLFAPEVDFFSIGTNDLLQYLFAADRQNRAVDYLYQPLNCAVWRLLRQVVEAGHAHGIPVGMCGEIAGDPHMTTALVGLGIDELSMSGASIPRVKNAIRAIVAKAAVQTVDELSRTRIG